MHFYADMHTAIPSRFQIDKLFNQNFNEAISQEFERDTLQLCNLFKSFRRNYIRRSWKASLLTQDDSGNLLFAKCILISALVWYYSFQDAICITI